MESVSHKQNSVNSDSGSNASKEFGGNWEISRFCLLYFSVIHLSDQIPRSFRPGLEMWMCDAGEKNWGLEPTMGSAGFEENRSVTVWIKKQLGKISCWASFFICLVNLLMQKANNEWEKMQLNKLLVKIPIYNSQGETTLNRLVDSHGAIRSLHRQTSVMELCENHMDQSWLDKNSKQAWTFPSWLPVANPFDTIQSITPRPHIDNRRNFWQQGHQLLNKQWLL